MGRDSSKRKHKKKHKKEKSLKKHKKEKSRKPEYSNSSSSSVSSDVDKKKKVKHEDWNFLDSVLEKSNFHVKNKDKNSNSSKDQTNVYNPQTNVRELNPYWKNNGNGLPSNLTLEKSKSLFLKPGEYSSLQISQTQIRSTDSRWRKKVKSNEDSITKKEENVQSQDEKPEKIISNTPKALSNDELNNLGAKILKAEILGNTALVEKLKAQLETAKKMKNTQSVDSNYEGKQKEVIILTDRKSQYVRKQLDKSSSSNSKRQKVDLLNAVDDKYSLNNLFVMEKSEDTEDFNVPSKLKLNNLDEFDDVYLDAASSKKALEKKEKLQQKKTMQDAVKKHKIVEGCSWCLDNKNDTKHLIVSTGNKCYLCLPQNQSLSNGHCYIVPIQHEMSTRKLDEDVWDELKTYQAYLTKMFSEKGMDVVFFESARSFKHYPHCFLQCVPLEKEICDLAPLYFQKALMESETEWSNNKKVIDFRNKDLRKSIPKDLPYFAVSFGTDGGFAHIIEDEQLFPRNFAEEIIGGMLDLDSARWRKPLKENFNAQRDKALAFLKMWKKYEFNDCNSSSSDSD